MNKKIILLGMFLIVVACAPRRDRLCDGSSLKLCEPTVYFAFGSATVEPINYKNLLWIKQKLDRWPDRIVLLAGHTDLVGENRYNDNLSKRRAMSVGDALVRLGVNPKQIKVKAVGSLKPLTRQEPHQHLNRRVDITFTHRPSAIKKFFE